MFRHILLPTDGSDLATAAVDKGIALAKELGAKVTLVQVVEAYHVMTLNPTQLEESLKVHRQRAAEQATKVLGEAEARAKAAGVEVATVIRAGERPAEQIIEAAAEVGADLIAMASHGHRGLRALVLGSQTARVIAESPLPVLVLR